MNGLSVVTQYLVYQLSHKTVSPVTNAAINNKEGVYRCSVPQFCCIVLFLTHYYLIVPPESVLCIYDTYGNNF